MVRGNQWIRTRQLYARPVLFRSTPSVVVRTGEDLWPCKRAAALSQPRIVTGDVEGILEVTSGVLLWDEEGVEAPEPGFHELRRWHLCESVI